MPFSFFILLGCSTVTVRGVGSVGGSLVNFMKKIRLQPPSLHGKSLRILKLESCKYFRKIYLEALWEGELE